MLACLHILFYLVVPIIVLLLIHSFIISKITNNAPFFLLPSILFFLTPSSYKMQNSVPKAKFVQINSGTTHLSLGQVVVNQVGRGAENIVIRRPVNQITSHDIYAGTLANIVDGCVDENRTYTAGLYINAVNASVRIDLAQVTPVSSIIVIIPVDTGEHDYPISHNWSLDLLADDGTTKSLTLPFSAFTTRSGANKGTYTFTFPR